MSDSKAAYMVCTGEKEYNKYLDPTYHWHTSFLNIADELAKKSKDPSTKCGAVIVCEKQRIKSMGYNGFPRGVADSYDRLSNRAIKYDLTVHAEVNAILFAQSDLEGHIIYTSPLPPCIRCAVQIVQAGIKHVICRKINDPLLKDRWAESVRKSVDIFNEVGITYLEI